ncbi:MAG: Rrf2 family transcriptional regulator [Bacteroidales bacterium]|nr:Rrf2 family transcriptional regulator [Bacteroidales bacterium]MBN2758622.1 Rrf2 family transcriptional regulator [Bacteroidales bacterium]
MLSNTCKYAIRAVIYLAVNEKKGEKIGIKKISTDLEMPSPFLGKILQMLSKNKLLDSTKGPNGGFSLGKDANKISLLDIVAIIDGLDFFHDCLIGVKICDDDPKKMELCPFHVHLDTLRDELHKQFKSLTIGKFRDGYYNAEEILKF